MQKDCPLDPKQSGLGLCFPSLACELYALKREMTSQLRNVIDHENTIKGLPSPLQFFIIRFTSLFSLDASTVPWHQTAADPFGVLCPLG